MKIGIITFHYALNVGAVLQAYALQSVLKSIGHEVEFIDYRPRRRYPLRSFAATSLGTTLNRWKDLYYGTKYRHDKDYSRILQISSTRYKSIETLRKNIPRYDLYIAGSDQIWNFRCKFPEAYFLTFLPNDIHRIAYAASMGQCHIPMQFHKRIHDALQYFEAIGVRENSGKEFITKVIGMNKVVTQVLDPTFLVNSSVYKGIMEPINTPTYYICSYILSPIEPAHSYIINTIYSHFRGCRFINLRNPDSGERLPMAENIIVTPYQWISYIRNSRFVICASFHAVVFSLLFHRPFIVLTPSSMAESGANERIASLLTPLGLMYRCFSSYDATRLATIIHERIDWQTIDRKIASQKEKSLQFLIRFTTDYDKRSNAPIQ